MIEGPEECDDGNTNSGDGCSSNCEIESGWGCTENSAGLSTCSQVSPCGNGVLEAAVNE